jgi:hypothetical protein
MLHDSKGEHIQHPGCRLRRGELDPRSGCGHADCRSSGSSPDTDGGAFSVGGGGQGWQALEDVQLIKRRTLVLSA